MKFIQLAVASAFALGASVSHAALPDDFNSYSPTDILNWVPPAASSWTVSDGTVDLIHADGNYGIPVAITGGHDGFIDLNGSSGSAGKFRTGLNLTVGIEYLLTFDLAGNQRSNNMLDDGVTPLDDIVNVVFGDTDQTFQIKWNDPFKTFSLNYIPKESGPAAIVFWNVNGHPSSELYRKTAQNIGPLLDNVNVAAVPEPETYAMLLAGLGILGFAAKRRKAQ